LHPGCGNLWVYASGKILKEKMDENFFPSIFNVLSSTIVEDFAKNIFCCIFIFERGHSLMA